MTIETALDASARVTLPQHVVHRSFPSETVVLNLLTGTYHGLNATAGRMLEELERTGTIAQAAATLAVEFGQDASLIESDMCELCRALLARDLVRLEALPPA
jgi:hypothetical protein